MKLYDRDYCILIDSEKNEYEEIQKEEGCREDGTKLPGGFKRNLYRKYPKAIRHNCSIFPNNFIDMVELSEVEKLKLIVDEFENILNDESTGEKEILNYINKQRAWHIVASILKGYNFGHHDTYIFPEFQLGTSYRADYLIVGKNSGGFEFVFVELESNTGAITCKDGSWGGVIRKGYEQVQDWKEWLDANYSSLKEVFNKSKKKDSPLPSEFYEFNSTRIHYVIVAGRREDFNEKTYQKKRTMKQKEEIELLHYDNLIDLARTTLGSTTY